MDHQDYYNPFETPIPRGVRVVQATLRVTVAIQCWGMAAARLHLGKSSPLAGFLEHVYEIPATRVGEIENWAAYGLILSGIVTLVRPCWPVLLPVAGWFLAAAIAPLLQEVGPVLALLSATQATRFAAPMALLLIDFWPPSLRPTLNFCRTTIGLLRLGLAVTFAAHGVLAMYQFRHGGQLVDLITRSAANVIHQQLDPEAVQQTLAIIGAVDIGAAFVLMTSRSKLCAVWMTFWGMITASSFFLAYGVNGYHESLLRISDGGAPLAILLFWVWAVREQEPQFVPE